MKGNCEIVICSLNCVIKLLKMTLLIILCMMATGQKARNIKINEKDRRTKSSMLLMKTEGINEDQNTKTCLCLSCYRTTQQDYVKLCSHTAS